MGAMASHITNLTVVYSIVFSGRDQRKHQSSASLALWGISPHAENVSIWWRHHVIFVSIVFVYDLAPSDARSSTNKLLSNFEWGLKLHISLQWHQNHMNNVHIFISAYVYDIFTDKIILHMAVSCWYLSNEQSPFIGNTPIKAAWNIKLLHPLTRATLRSHLSVRRAMKESCHGNAFRITGPLWGEYIEKMNLV